MFFFFLISGKLKRENNTLLNIMEYSSVHIFKNERQNG